MQQFTNTLAIAPESKRRERSLRNEAGSTLVEFALVFILLMTMLLGIIGFGRALYTYHFLSNTAREATRWAIVNGATCASDSSCAAPASTTDIQNWVSNHLPPAIDPSKVTAVATFNPAGSGAPPACTNPGPDNSPGCTVQVQITYAFTFNLPLLPTPTFNLTSSSEMIIAH